MEYYEGDDPIGYVIALNMLRRHLTVGQRAALAVAALPYFEAQADARRKATLLNVGTNVPGASLPEGSPKGKAAEFVGEKFGIGHASVEKAKSISLNAPDLMVNLKDGSQTLSSAYEEMQRRQAASPGAYDGSKAHESEPEKLATQFENRIMNAYGNFRGTSWVSPSGTVASATNPLD